MAYRIKGVIRLSDDGDANLGIVTATNVDVGVGSVTAADLYGKVSKEAITDQTAGDDTNITGADELLIYDLQTDSPTRVSVDDFVAGSGIGTIVSDFTHVDSNSLVVTGLSTLGGIEVGAGIITAASGSGIVTFYGDGSNLEGIVTTPTIVSTTQPTTRGNGDPLQEGDLWFDSSSTGTGNLRQYTYYNSQWVDSNPANAIPSMGFSGETGTGSIALADDTFNIVGDDNIDTDATTSTQLTISLKDDVAIAGSMTANRYYGDGSFLSGIGTAGVSGKHISPSSVETGIITATTGIITDLSVSGVATFYDGVSGKVAIGTQGVSDLGIRHNGTDGSITNTTGDLIIQNGDDNKDVLIRTDNSSGGVVAYIRADGSSGEVQLSHFNDIKLNTTATGVVVSGILTANNFSGDGSGLTNVTATATAVGVESVDAAETDTQYLTFSESQSGVATIRTNDALTYNANTGRLSANRVESSLIEAKSGESLTLDGVTITTDDDVVLGAGLTVSGVTTTTGEVSLIGWRKSTRQCHTICWYWRRSNRKL